MQDLIFYILAGGSVGLVVGMTGVGGGSLMTPILLAFGFTPAIAIGTDLLYAAITKAGGILAHRKQNTIDWSVVASLALGSIPASILTTIFLGYLKAQNITYEHILTLTLGIMLTLTALVLLFRSFLLQERQQLAAADSPAGRFEYRHRRSLTIISGIALGVFVTLSSVGAGAFGAAVLMTLYPRMAMIRVIGTDIAHAVPLTAIAGLGHLQLGHVDGWLLFGLLCGSLPAIWVGTKLATRVPEKLMQRIMAGVLLVLGLRYTFF